MEEESNEQETHHLLPRLESLKTASKSLQTNPVSIIYNNFDFTTAIEALLELGNKANAVISQDPSLFNLTHLLSNLKTHLEKLEKLQGYGLRCLLRRQVAYYRISQFGFAVESEIQSYIDQKNVQSFVKIMKESDQDDEKVKALMGLKSRLEQGFDKDYQELILRAKVFPILEFIICESMCSSWVRDQAAVAVLGLVKFNKDVFVGLVLMGPIVRALIQMGSCSSIQVVTSLVKIIRTTLVDEISGEVTRIIKLLDAEELAVRAAAMNCIFEVAIFGREEVIALMLREGLIEKMMGLQRLEVEEENGEKFPFLRCVASFSVQVEVGEGLERNEKREIKLETLRRVKEASVSDAEAATAIAEVLWGSSPY